MSSGFRCATASGYSRAVYVPKDRSQTYPILLSRTPYSVQPYGVDAYRSDLGPSALFGSEGYIVVYQDVRGRWMSEGEFVNMRPHKDAKSGPTDIDESTDTFDTIDWLIKNIPNHNGKVGMWGISYPGFYTAAGMIDAHPASRRPRPRLPSPTGSPATTGTTMAPCSCPMPSTSSHSSAIRVPSRPRRNRPSGSTTAHPTVTLSTSSLGPLSNVNKKYFKDDVPFWNEIMQHANYDEFWTARNLRPHLKNIRPAVLTVGGWFDAENMYRCARDLQERRGHQPRRDQRPGDGSLAPWRLGAWRRFLAWPGSVSTPTPPNTTVNNIEFPFFQYFLKGKGTPSFPEAWVFETGTNQWREYDTWPPRKTRARSLYLNDSGRISYEPPEGSAARRSTNTAAIPRGPVEFIDQITQRMTRRLHDPGSAVRLAPA